MQMIVDIDDNLYNRIKYLEPKADTMLDALMRSVQNGTPLPKGHGRLIDEERISLSGIHFKTERDHAMMIGRLNSAITIIEADNEREDKK